MGIEVTMLIEASTIVPITISAMSNVRVFPFTIIEESFATRACDRCSEVTRIWAKRVSTITVIGVRMGGVLLKGGLSCSIQGVRVLRGLKKCHSFIVVVHITLHLSISHHRLVPL